MTTTRRCKHYKETKQLTYFVPHPLGKEGYTYTCKKCENLRRKQSRMLRGESEKTIQSRKQYYKNNRKHCIAMSKKWIVAHPEKKEEYANRNISVYQMHFNLNKISPTTKAKLWELLEAKERVASLRRQLEEEYNKENTK